MSYATLEASAQDGRPIYKFLFVKGSTEYRYTSASFFVSDSTGTFEPVAITASNITQTNELAKNGIKIELPRDNTVAQLFLGKVPEQTTSLTIFRTHDAEDASDQFVYWKGRVAAAQADGDSVTLECEDIFTSMQRPGLRARYQKGCRHALYSSACGVNINDYGDASEISSQSGVILTVSINPDSTGGSVIDRADGYYNGGIVELSDGSMRYIINHVGSQLTLISAFDDLEIDSLGVTCTLYPGCAHNMSDCNLKFNNLDNYGGFPFIPGKNPFRGSVEGSIA
jgi:uncharacterized phage protein (TIGR02218 family)